MWTIVFIFILNINESFKIMPYNFWSDLCGLLAEQLDTKANVKLGGGVQSQLEASNASSYTEKLWYNETVCLWMTICEYIS